MRIVIGGGPRTGKTNLANGLGLWRRRTTTTIDDGLGLWTSVHHTDDTMKLGWSKGSERVATWFDAPGPWIVEGVAAVRALRKWLIAHPVGQPCDKLIWLTRPHEALSKGQLAMAKGCETVLAEILGELKDRDIQIEMGPTR